MMAECRAYAHWLFQPSRSEFVKTGILKMLLFVALMGGFYAFDGFERPRVERGDYRSNPKMARAWVTTVAMFVAGAVLAVWGNQIAEQVDWDIPAGMFPTIGVMLLVAGFVWMLMVRDAARL